MLSNVAHINPIFIFVLLLKTGKNIDTNYSRALIRSLHSYIENFYLIV